MRTTLTPFATSLLACLCLASCDSRKSVHIAEEQEARDQQSEAESVRAKDPDPVPGLSQPGSRMDPSSNAYIILDGSGSMTGEPIVEAKRAVASFIRSAPENLNIGLFVFDQNRQSGKELVPLGRGSAQRGELLKAIQGVQAGGGTPLGSALKAGTDALIHRFQMQLRYGDIRLIVVTDGEASDPRVFDSAIQHAHKYHVPVYTIGFRMRSNHPLRHYSEAYLTAQDEQQLLNAMKETLAELDDSAEL